MNCSSPNFYYCEKKSNITVYGTNENNKQIAKTFGFRYKDLNEYSVESADAYKVNLMVNGHLTKEQVGNEIWAAAGCNHNETCLCEDGVSPSSLFCTILAMYVYLFLTFNLSDDILYYMG